MSNNKPLVSVIVPTYNRGHYLELTLKSIVQQTYTNIEIIVVDDGSVGIENQDICNKFTNVKYVKIDNSGGPCRPRNIGISKSKGTYVAFVDDDDIWHPEKIDLQVDILENNPDFGLVHNYCNVIDEHGEETNETVGRPGKPKDKHGNVLNRMIGNWTLMMPTPLLRKSVIDEVGFFNEDIPQTFADVEYWSRCAFHTKFYYLDEALVNYRKHSNNMSANNKVYIDLPIYLFNVVDRYYRKGAVNKEIYKKLQVNLCLSQSKNIKRGFLKTIKNLFRIDTFWFFNFRVHKTILKKMIS